MFKKKEMLTIILILETSIVSHVVENEKASVVELNEKKLMEIDRILATCEIVSDRYHSTNMKFVNE